MCLPRQPANADAGRSANGQRKTTGREMNRSEP
jgi:hypothetical protein